MSALAMEISSYNKSNSLNEEHLFHSAIQSTNAENPYSFMQEITQGINENKKIKRLHRVLSKNGLNTESFLEKFFETKKINFIAQEKGCSAHEAKKILDHLPSSKLLTFPQAEIAFSDKMLPKTTRNLITKLIKQDEWFKDVPINIAYSPEVEVVASITPQQSVSTKTIDITVGPLFYLCCETDTQKSGCMFHEFAHAKRKHAQETNYIISKLPKCNRTTLNILHEYEADLFAAAESVSSARAVESTLNCLKKFANSNETISEASIASKLPATIRQSLDDEYLSSITPFLTKKPKSDYPLMAMRHLNAKMVRGLLELEIGKKDSCYLM